MRRQSLEQHEETALHRAAMAKDATGSSAIVSGRIVSQFAFFLLLSGSNQFWPK